MKRICALFLVLLATINAKSITLDECYRLSRENYPLIRQYDLIEKSSVFSFANASKAYLPQLAFLGQATYQSEVTSFPDQMNELYQRMGISFEGLSRDQYKLMLQLSQNLWDGGLTKAKKEGIKADEKVSRLSLDKEMDALKTRINQVYFGILALEANIQLNDYADTLLSGNLKTIQSGVNNGVAMQSDLDNVKVELLTLRQQRTQLEKSIYTYRHILSLLIGTELQPNEAIERPSTLEITTDNNRIELQFFDAQIEQNQARRNLLNASLSPRFDLFAQGWYGRPGLNVFEDMLTNQFSWNYLAGVRLQWNIGGLYTHGNDLNKISLSNQSVEVQRNIFVWNVRQQQIQLENEVAKMQQMKQSDAEIVALRQTIRKASESKYKNGVITVTDLLRDITNENQAIQTQTIHELELLKNIYDLKVTLNQ